MDRRQLGEWRARLEGSAASWDDQALEAEISGTDLVIKPSNAYAVADIVYQYADNLLETQLLRERLDTLEGILEEVLLLDKKITLK